MKRFAVLLLCVLTAAAVSWAGGSKESGAAAGARPAGGFQYTGTGPVTDKPVTLSILATNAYYSSVDLAVAPVIQELTKRAGVTIDWQLLPPGNYKDAVSPRLAAGQGLADIVYLPDQDPTMKYIQGKLFIPIDDLYARYGVNLKKLYAGELAGAKASLTTPDGKMYYVPQTALANNYQPCFMVNLRWLKQVGLSEPATLEEFTAMLRRFKSGDPNANGKQDEIPLSITKGNVAYGFSPIFGINLASRFYGDKDGKAHFAFLEPAYKEYLTYLNGLYKEGLLESSFATTTRDQIIARFAQNITGTAFDFSWHMSSTFSAQFKDYNRETPVVKGILPLKGPHGDQFYLGRNPISGMFGISKDCKNPEVAFRFLDFAVGDEAQELYVYGIEGITYTLANGKKQFTEQGRNNDFIQKFGINAVNVPLRQSTAATDTLLPAWHVAFDRQVLPFMRSPWPFLYYLPNESTVENQYMTDINTYVDEMDLKFITGAESLANFDKYLETLRKMNIETVLNVRQVQWDRYRASSR